MNGIRRIGLFHLLLVIYVQSARSLCNMPAAWLGSWYQRGMSSLLEITVDHVQTKGSCLGVLPNEQYYLFYDRLNRCTRCLLFIERHGNLLQYRESECSDADDLSNVTSCPNMIAPDAALYTLHRNDSKPQSCPIQAPFRLTSLRRDDSICRQASSSSYVGECANDNQFRLHLAPCSPYQRALDLQLACVGTWIDGFHTYFVARVLAADSSDRNNQYACFHFVTKHKDLTSTVSLSMATDDSCRDLNSKYMSTVMTLASPTRQIENESNRSCAFPDEWQRYDWYSLNRTIQMIPTQADLELRHLDGNGNHRRWHCLQTLEPFAYRIRSFTNCEPNEECLRIHQRTNNVLELTLSDCHERRLKRTLTVVATGNSPSSCPSRIGHLLLESSHLHRHQHRQAGAKKRAFRMSVGCGNRQKLTIYNAEKDPESRLLTQTDTCLASWQSDDLSTTYLIAQSIHSNATYCLTFHTGDSILIRNSSRECSSHHLSDETSISIYSAKLLNPCSRSQRLPVGTLLRLLVLLIVAEHVR